MTTLDDVSPALAAPKDPVAALTRRVRLEQRLFRAAFAVFGRGPAAGRRGAVVIGVPGKGNVGDQAMLDACAATLGTPLDLVVRDPGDLVVPPGATEVVLPDLLYGGLALAIVQAVRLARRTRTARTLVVMGADIMDGAYSDTASSRRFLVADAASRVVDARVVGFSFNERPRPRSLAALAALSPAVTLAVRDTVSLDRLRGRTAARLTPVADLVFSLDRPSTDTDASRFLDHERAEGRRVAVLNANALVEARQPHQHVLAAEARRLLDAGFSVLIVPHDGRNTPSDVSLAGDLSRQLNSPHAAAAPLLQPAQVLGVVERADLVVTGRMHLAILALGRGVPVVSIAYQGKVAGLFAALGIAGNVVEPSRLEADLPATIDAVLADIDGVRATIAAHLPELRRASALNLAGAA